MITRILILLGFATVLFAQRASGPGRDSHFVYQSFFELHAARVDRLERQANGNSSLLALGNARVAQEVGLSVSEWAKVMPMIRQGNDDVMKVRAEWRSTGLASRPVVSPADRQTRQRLRNQEGLIVNKTIQRMRASLGQTAWAKLADHVNSVHRNRFQSPPRPQ